MPMRAVLNLFLILLASVSFFACKKKNVVTCANVHYKNYTYDTVHPSDYIMTYPGSWWKYSNGSTDSCFSWETVSIAESFDNENCKTIHEDKKILPYSSYGFIAFESRVISYDDYKTTQFHRIVGEAPGVLSEDAVDVDPGTQFKAIRTSLGQLGSLTIGATVYNDVIHVQEAHQTYYSHTGGGPITVFDYFYCRNVGIIRKIKTTNGHVEDTVDLVEHYIAPH